MVKKVRLMYGPASGTDVEVGDLDTVYRVAVPRTAFWSDEPPKPTDIFEVDEVRYVERYGSNQWYPEKRENFYKGAIWDGHRPEGEQGESGSVARGGTRSEGER